MVDVDEHCLHLVHSHHGVHVIERRGVPEERMGSAEPLTGRSSPIEGPIGEDDDLGQQHEAIRLVGGERAGLAPPSEGAGGDAEDQGETRV